MKRKPTLAPRNPLVAPSMFRKAGAHDKSHKAKRRAAKVDLMRGWPSGAAPGFYPGRGWVRIPRPAPIRVNTNCALLQNHYLLLG